MILTRNKSFKTVITSGLVIAAISASTLVSDVQPAAADSKDVIKGAIGGVVAGAIIGNAIKNKRERETEVRVYEDRRAPTVVYEERRPTRQVSSYEAHVDWCYDNRRKYRETDNTYRKRGVGRVECRSPYLN